MPRRPRPCTLRSGQGQRASTAGFADPGKIRDIILIFTPQQRKTDLHTSCYEMENRATGSEDAVLGVQLRKHMEFFRRLTCHLIELKATVPSDAIHCPGLSENPFLSHRASGLESARAWLGDVSVHAREGHQLHLVPHGANRS